MLTALVLSAVFGWVVILALVIAILALARQVGVLHMRVAPAGALTTAGGPSVGAQSGAIPATAPVPARNDRRFISCVTEHPPSSVATTSWRRRSS